MFPITCNAVGDIIALATFVLDIIRALDETRGSVPEYSDFVGELRAMHTMLVAVVRISQDTMDGVLRKEIVSEVDHCGKDVQRALARIVRFSALESAGARSSSMRVQLARQWYKLEWRFSQRGKSEVVRAELRAATQRLTTLLVISNADGAARFRNLLADQFRALVEREAANSCAMGGIRSSLCELQISSRRDHAFVDELFRSAPNGIDSRTVAVAVLCAAVCAMHGTNRTVPTALLLIAIYILSRSGMHHARALPKEVSYTEMNALTLLDALGRRMVLPLELCETYDIFHATLVNLFSKTNGRWFIDTYAYDLTDAHTDQCVLRDGPWGSIVRTGTKLEMSVIVHQVTSGRELPQCPWCLDPAFECTGRTAMKCRSCDRIFDVATKGTLSGPPDSRFELEYGKDGYDDIKGVKDYTYTHTGARTKTAGVRPYTDHLVHDTSQGQAPAQAGNGSGHSSHNGPWRSQVQDFKHIRVLCDRFILHPSCRNQQSELHPAAGNGHLTLLGELLDQGANVDTHDLLGHTPLHYAANRGHIQVMELLLDRGADIEAVPKVNNLTPLACVVWRHQSTAAKLLLARGALINDAVSYAVTCVGDLDTTEAIAAHRRSTRR